MGNRAIIKPVESRIGVYLHWNGGKGSVAAFLKYCELHGYRDFGGKYADGYGIARFCQVVGNFFGGGSSLGVCVIGDSEKDAEGIDNGIYIVDGWNVVKTVGNQHDDSYDLTEMLLSIDEKMPESERLGKDFITADEVPVSEIKVGDTVFVFDIEEHIETHTVTGVISRRNTKGEKVSVPCISKYDEGNPNNELHGINGKIRRLKKNGKTTEIDGAKEIAKLLNSMEIGENIKFTKRASSNLFGFKKIEMFNQRFILIGEYAQEDIGFLDIISINKDKEIEAADIRNILGDITIFIAGRE